MSYLFNGGRYEADFGSGVLTNVYPYTVAMYFKQTTHPQSDLHIFGSLTSTLGSGQHRHNLRNRTILDQYGSSSYGGTGLYANANKTVGSSRANLWTPFVFVAHSNSSKRFAIIGESDATNSNLTDHTNPPRYLTVGSSADSNWVLDTKIAEVAIWNIALDADQRAAYIAGDLPSTIAAANLIGYWSLLNNEGTTVPDQSGNAGPNLVYSAGTVSYNADHPDIYAPAPEHGVLSLEPLHYGGVLQANKSNVEFHIVSGHVGYEGELLALGQNGATDLNGVFVTSGLPVLGMPNDDVSIILYWTEGTAPVDNRSLVIKTTLVAA